MSENQKIKGVKNLRTGSALNAQQGGTLGHLDYANLLMISAESGVREQVHALNAI